MTFDMSDLYGIFPHGEISHISYISHIPHKKYIQKMFDIQEAEGSSAEREVL